TEDSLVESGLVTGTHGLRGDLKVRALSGDPQALLTAEVLYLRTPDGHLRKTTPLRQSLHKGLVLLRLVGFESLTAVEGLRGGKILLDQDSLPALDKDEFYWHQIEGASVIDRQQGEIGVLKSMFTTAAHDNWVVEGAYGEVMIPVVEAFIVKVDVQLGRIEVDLPEGLIGTDT
ncbi:MAG: ribosome maturation factor RimM, partial [Geopsychrobacter sp.]|nr:ribosome maturation factor RimM [Geopsychrobacter sp.]